MGRDQTKYITTGHGPFLRNQKAINMTLYPLLAFVPIIVVFFQVIAVFKPIAQPVMRTGWESCRAEDPGLLGAVF